MEATENLLAIDLQIDDIGMSHLKETAKWAKFLAVVGMVLSCLIALMGVFAGFLLNSFSRYGRSSDSFIGAGFISVFYIFIAAVFFITSIYLYFFGSKMKIALQSTDQLIFNDALLNLKRYYRIIGIITIIYLGFLVLVLVLGIFAASFTRLGR